MMFPRKALLFTFLITNLGFFSHPAHAEDGFDEGQWQISNDGIEILDKDNQRIVQVTRGEMTYQGSPFKDGSIEFEMFSEGERAFVYVYFREQSKRESEVVYLRTHKSNLPDTVQYSPVYQGHNAWQLYHGAKGTVAASLPPGEWVRVRLLVAGRTLSMWVGDSDTPVFSALPLTGPEQAGTVTLRGYVPNVSQASYSTRFRNIRIDRAAEPIAGMSDAPPPETTRVTRMLVSASFPADKAPVTTIPATVLSEAWQAIDAEPDGLFEYLRWRPIPADTRSWAIAADVTLMSSEAGDCRLKVGFSDALTLMLNGRVLAHADASYRYSDNRQEGLLHDEQLSLFLPLQRGANHLRTIVADSFGGWGFLADLEDCPGVTATATEAPRG